MSNRLHGIESQFDTLAAIKDHDHEELEKKLKQNGLFSGTIQGGRTLLYFAIEQKSYKAVELLIYYDVDVNFVDNHGDTCLNFAICEKQIDIALLLLEAGAKPHIDMNYRSSLYHSLKTGNKVLVRKLIEAGADISDIGGDECVIREAIRQRANHSFIEFLFDLGAKIKHEDSIAYYRNPLLTAVSNRDSDLLELLLRKGANPNGLGLLKGLDNRSWVDRESCLRVLVDHGMDLKYLGRLNPKTYLSIAKYDKGLLKAIGHKIRDYYVTDTGETLLTAHCDNTYNISQVYGNKLNMLIEEGLDIDQVTNNTRTPYINTKNRVSYFLYEFEKKSFHANGKYAINIRYY